MSGQVIASAMWTYRSSIPTSLRAYCCSSQQSSPASSSHISPARGVTALKRFVYQESSAGDELLVFDLLLFGMFGQVAVVVANVYDDIHYLIHTFPRQHFDLGGIWRFAIWPDHELRLRVAIVVALFVLPWCAAAWLGYLRSERRERAAVPARFPGGTGSDSRC